MNRRRRRLLLAVGCGVAQIVAIQVGWLTGALTTLAAGVMSWMTALLLTSAIVAFKVGLRLNERVTDALAEEMTTRVMRAPAGLVWLAARRLPEPMRSEVVAEWTAELAAIAAECIGLPVTSYFKKLVRSLAFSIDLLRAGHSLQNLPPAPSPANGGSAQADGVKGVHMRIPTSGGDGYIELLGKDGVVKVTTYTLQGSGRVQVSASSEDSDGNSKSENR